MFTKISESISRRVVSTCSTKLQGFHDYFASQVKVNVDRNMVTTFSTPIAVFAAVVSSDINNFLAFAGISDLDFCWVFVCHAVINVRSLASHLQGFRKSIADEVAQVAKPVATMSIPIASMSI